MRNWNWSNISVVATAISSLILIFTYFSGALTFPDFLQKYGTHRVDLPPAQSDPQSTAPAPGTPDNTSAAAPSAGGSPTPATSSPTIEAPTAPVDSTTGTTTLPTSPDEICQQFTSTQYCVSSVLAPVGNYTYGPENLFDSDPNTAWAPNTLKATDGLGEWILLRFARPRSVGAIVIANGYQKKDRDIYYKNDRPHDIEILLSNGRSTTVALEDSMGVQRIALSGATDIDWIQVTIRSVYPGSKYQDVGISDIGAE